MPFILALLGVLSVAAVWYWRVKMAREAGGELLDAAADVRAAVRRFGYRRRADVHPADAVEDSRLAAAGVMAAVAGVDGALSRAEIDAIAAEARRVFGAGPAEADEIAAFGRWVAGQCGTPEEAVRRLTRAIRRLAGDAAGPDLVAMAERVARADGALPNERQDELLHALRRGFERR
ncbi:MAG: TerB family tellurite resistance protein [Paracoccaceae bacterium]